MEIWVNIFLVLSLSQMKTREVIDDTAAQQCINKVLEHCCLRRFLLTDEAARAMMDVGWDFVPEVSELQSAFESGGVEECTSMLERKRDEWKNIPVNVAVTGSSGVGKSSFIDAIRRLTADDDGAAAVGVKETTFGISCFPHPNNPLLKFWDLPGVGTDRSPRQKYLSAIDVDWYDFFLLITADRFTDNDTWLGNEFRKRNMKYFFVRTKIGVDISNNKKSHPRTHDERAVVEDIRASTRQHLRENGCEDVPVFLIDNYKLDKFEFDQLEQHLVDEFPKLKKTALLLSLQATSKEMIGLKVAELRSRMWKLAALSGAVAMAPVPGVIVVFDLALVVKEADFYYTQLGLDETSLKRYAKLTSTDYRQLQSIVNRCLGCRAIGVAGMKTMVEELYKSAPSLVTSTAIEESSKLIPLIGSFIAGSLSFGGTYLTLKLVLDKMESVALEVMQFAAESAAVADQSDED